jgi:hypothetical protein
MYTRNVGGGGGRFMQCRIEGRENQIHKHMHHH